MADTATDNTVTASPSPAPEMQELPGHSAQIEPDPANGPNATGPATPEIQQPENPTNTIPEQQQQSGPVALIPQKRAGLGGIVDDFRNALAGTRGSDVYINPDTGEHYIQHPYLTGKQQWMKIGSEALMGAARGLAAGKGAGNMGRGVLAAAQGQQQDQEKLQANQEEDAAKDYATQRDARIQKANAVMQEANLAESSLRLSRLQTQATDENIEFSQKRNDYFRNLSQTGTGTYEIGTFKDASTIHELKTLHPDIWNDHLNDNAIKIVPQFDENGKHAGATFWYSTPGANNDRMPQGTKFPHFVNSTDPMKPGHLEYSEASDPMTRGAFDNYNTTAANALNADGARIQKLQDQAAQAELRKEQAKTQKTVQAKNTAQTSEIPSKIALNEARAKEATAKAEKDNAAGNPESLVNLIGTGQIAAGRLSYLITRNPGLLDEVARKFPGFDSSKVESYAAAYKKFTSGPEATALNAGGTALEHLQELRALNTNESHIPHSPDWTAYQNKADTLATELAKFYGDATIPAIRQIKDTLTSTLPGNREKAITTQAQSMGRKLDNYEHQWHNASPSAAYQALYPDISDEAKDARAGLDPAYAQRRAGGGPPPAAAGPPAGPPAAKPGAIQPQPGEQVFVNKATQQRTVLRNNKYVDLANGQEVR